MTVPEWAQSLSDLSLVVGADSLSASADAVGRDDDEVRVDDLDDPDEATRLFELPLLGPIEATQLIPGRVGREGRDS